MTGRIKIRISRAWRGYKVGDVIQPVAALRQQLLRQKDQLGNKIAVEVKEEAFEQTPPAARVVEKGDVPKVGKPKQTHDTKSKRGK